MKKKKKNPNRIPMPRMELDVRQSTGEIADDIVFLAWLEFLGALADFPEMSQERIWSLWKDINKTVRKTHPSTEVEEWIRNVEEISGIHLPYARLTSATISTQGELNRYMRKTKRNALSCAYAIIVHPILEEALLPQEEVRRLVQKTYSLHQELEDGRICIQDIQGVLTEELGLFLEAAESGVNLVRTEKGRG